MMKKNLSRAAKFAAILYASLLTANAFVQTARAGTQMAGSQKTKECKRAVTNAAVNCVAAVVSGAASIVTLDPPANVIVGIGVPAGVCANEAYKVAEACGSANGADDKSNCSR